MRRELTWVAALVAGSLALACGKAPAQVALKAADAAIEAARPEVERYAPQEFKALADLSRAAHDKFNQGDYKGALADAEALPARVKAGLAAAQARKEELARAWTDLQANLPAMLATATTRLAELSTKRKLPAGVDKAKLAQAKTELDSIAQTWTETTASFQKGDVREAVAKARTVKARIEGLMAGLGITAPAPPAPAP
ncbi:MAG TPA: hypothetical protein VKI41_15775 [Vicinamibacteria bacterium]|nr:hypothetical protein [Vicinamibacteria bacterium]